MGKKGQCLLISSEQIFVFTGVNLALSVRLGAELSTQVAAVLQPGSRLQWVNEVAELLCLGSRRESKVTHPSRLKKPAWLRATVTVQAAFGKAASLCSLPRELLCHGHRWKCLPHVSVVGVLLALPQKSRVQSFPAEGWGTECMHFGGLSPHFLTEPAWNE